LWKMCGAPNDASNAVSAGNERWKEVERREEATRGWAVRQAKTLMIMIKLQYNVNVTIRPCFIHQRATVCLCCDLLGWGRFVTKFKLLRLKRLMRPCITTM
jgi:hypothetical protein